MYRILIMINSLIGLIMLDLNGQETDYQVSYDNRMEERLNTMVPDSFSLHFAFSGGKGSLPSDTYIYFNDLLKRNQFDIIRSHLHSGNTLLLSISALIIDHYQDSIYPDISRNEKQIINEAKKSTQEISISNSCTFHQSVPLNTLYYDNDSNVISNAFRNWLDEKPILLH